MGMAEYHRAQQDVSLYSSRVVSYQIKVSNIQQDLAVYQAAIDRGDPAADPKILANIQNKLSQAQERLTEANNDLANARKTVETALSDSKSDDTTTIKSPEATNESSSDKSTTEKYTDPNKTPSKTQAELTDKPPAENSASKPPADADPSSVRKGTVPAGAQRTTPEPATAKWAGVNDLRVIIKVNKDYLTGKSSSLSGVGGILFPYTPQISYETQATYGSLNPLHSNYTQYFFKNSSVSAIQISGKFTVQNEKDGLMWLATQHVLRSLVKMTYGSDKKPGSPPPICRLNGFGDYQLANVPVAIQSFKFDLPDGVDYIRIKKDYENSLVPTISTLSVTVIPMYSREEIQNYSVDKFISGALTGKGFL